MTSADYWPIVLRAMWSDLNVTLPWPQQVPIYVSLASFFVAYRTLAMQRRLLLETVKLTARVDYSDTEKKTGLHMRITIVNTGPVPITVTKLGLEDPQTGNIFAPKWPKFQTPLPKQLTQGTEATIEYFGDQFETTLRLDTSRIAVAEIATGKQFRTRIKDIDRWVSANNNRSPTIGDADSEGRC